MNFFGHLVVARWRGATVDFALGAMLPDWSGMSGVKLGPATGELAGGIAFHHESDHAFHQLRSFRDLEQRARAELERRGVGRGPARGAAHVAVELLLDGVLIEREPAASPLYLAAVGTAPGHAEVWDAHPRMTWLLERLINQGVPRAYCDPAQVAQRTMWALSARPRLSPDEREQAEIAAAMPALADEVRARAHEVVAAMREWIGGR